MSTLDVLIAIPVVPLIPILITWWLPWERWLPAKVPKIILGPYLIYASFAAWHFRLGRWTVILMFLLGTVTFLVGLMEHDEKQRDTNRGNIQT